MDILIRDIDESIVDPIKKLTWEKTGAKAAVQAMIQLPGKLQTIKEQEETILKQRCEIIQLEKELKEIRKNLKGIFNFISKE